MSFLDMPGLEDVKEAVAVAEGPYDLIVIQADITEKDGKSSIRMILEIEGEPDAGNVFHYVSLPHEDDDVDKRKTKMLFAKRFFHQFSIKTDNGVDMEALVGSRASAARLSQEEYPEGSGQLKNSLSCDPLPQEA